MTIRQFFHLAFSLLVGIAFALTTFAGFLQPWGGQGLRVAGLLVGMSLVFGVIASRVLGLYILPMLGRSSRLAAVGWVTLCLLIGQVLIASAGLRVEDIHFLFPKHTLSIQNTGRSNPASSGSAVGIHDLSDGDTYQFDLRTFQYSSDWTIENGVLQSDLPGPAAAAWQGSLLNRGRLVLVSGPWGGIVQVVWDGQSQEVDLYAPGEQLFILKLGVDNPPARPFRILAAGAYGLSLTFFLLALAAIWYHLPPPRPAQKQAGIHFLWFALPMLVVWGGYLMLFYPGILSSDSTDQWSMILGLKPVTDWHPAAHTLLWGLVSQVWRTPAAMALVQIVALSLVAAWGIRVLIDLGLPLSGGWLISLLFALSPVNGVMSITMWKDIPYAISLFGLFLLGLRVVASDGRWANRPGRWLWLGLAGAATGLFRHNGAAVAGVALVALLVAYRRYWRPLI